MKYTLLATDMICPIRSIGSVYLPTWMVDFFVVSKPMEILDLLLLWLEKILKKSQMVVFFFMVISLSNQKNTQKLMGFVPFETTKLPGIQCPVFLQKLVKSIQICRDAHCDDLWTACFQGHRVG